MNRIKLICRCEFYVVREKNSLEIPFTSRDLFFVDFVTPLLIATHLYFENTQSLVTYMSTPPTNFASGTENKGTYSKTKGSS